MGSLGSNELWLVVSFNRSRIRFIHQVAMWSRCQTNCQQIGSIMFWSGFLWVLLSYDGFLPGFWWFGESGWGQGNVLGPVLSFFSWEVSYTERHSVRTPVVPLCLESHSENKRTEPQQHFSYTLFALVSGDSQQMSLWHQECPNSLSSGLWRLM